MTDRHRYTPAERRRIFGADRIPLTPWAVCRYCGGIVHRDNFHVAHEYPVSRWPWWLPKRWRDSLVNVGVAHPACNMSAGAEPMTFWQSISLRWKLRMIGAGIVIFSIIIFLMEMK